MPRNKFAAAVFDDERINAQTAFRDKRPFHRRYVKDSRGWILFGPQDIRNGEPDFLFCLQQLPSQKQPYVRVGCRYYNLKEAWEHWSFKAKTGKISGRDRWGVTTNKNEGRQAIAIIRLMLEQAQAYGLIGTYAKLPKFDSSLMRKKK